MKRAQLGEALFLLALEAHCMIDRVKKGGNPEDAHQAIRDKRRELFAAATQAAKRNRSKCVRCGAPKPCKDHFKGM